MIVEAIKETYPDLRKVMVDLQTIRWTNPRTQKRYIALTPQGAGLALVAFDQAQAIEPFDLALRATQVTTATVKKPGPKAGDASQLSLTDRERKDRTDRQRRESGARARAGRGRKKVRADGTTEGGKPLITGHLSNVQVSRQNVRVYGRRLLRG